MVTIGRGLRRKRTVTAVALIAAVVGGTVWWSTRGSPRAHVVATLSTLAAPVPGLSPPGRPVVTRPSCDAFDYCVSAAFTWRAATPHRTFATVSRSVKAWAVHNHLGRPVWSCAPRKTGLFGSETHAGCEAGFVPGRPSATSVFVAVTFTDPDALRPDPATSRTDGMPPTSPQLQGAVVGSISAQVVDGVHPIE